MVVHADLLSQIINRGLKTFFKIRTYAKADVMYLLTKGLRKGLQWAMMHAKFIFLEHFCYFNVLV